MSMGISGLDVFTAVTFLDGHSSAEFLESNSKRRAVYALGIECKHDATSKHLIHKLILS